VERQGPIHEILWHAKRRVKLLELCAALVAVLAFVVLFFAIEVVVDHLVPLSKEGRLAFLIALCTALAYILVRLVLVPMAKKVNDLYIAKLYDKRVPELRDLLSSYVDLARDEAIPQQYTDILRDEVIPKLNRVKLSDVITPRQLRRAALALAGVVVFAVVYTIVSPKSVGQSLRRAYQPLADIAPPVKTAVLEVLPGDTQASRIVEGERVEITARLSGSRPESVELMTSRDSVAWRAVPMMKAPGKDMVWRAVIPKVQSSFAYYVRAGDGTSPRYRVITLRRPEVETVSFEIELPEYMGLEPVTTTKPNIETYIGARVKVAGTATKPLASAAIHMEGVEIPLEVTAERHFSGAFTVEQGSRYWFRLIDGLGTTSYANKFNLIAQRDRPPIISIAQPSAPVVAVSGTGARVPVVFSVHDDFGISSVRLVLEIRDETFSFPVDVPAGATLLQRVATEVLVTADRFNRGDSIDCRVDACDNRTGEGGEASSSRFTILVDTNPPELEPEQVVDAVECTPAGGTATSPVMVRIGAEEEELPATGGQRTPGGDEQEEPSPPKAPRITRPLVDAGAYLEPQAVSASMRKRTAKEKRADEEPESIRLVVEDKRLLQKIAQAVRARAARAEDGRSPEEAKLVALAADIELSLGFFVPPDQTDMPPTPERLERDENAPEVEKPDEVRITEGKWRFVPDSPVRGIPGTMNRMVLNLLGSATPGMNPAAIFDEFSEGTRGGGTAAQRFVENIDSLTAALGRDTELAAAVSKDLGWSPGELSEFTRNFAKAFKVRGVDQTAEEEASEESIGGAGTPNDRRVRLAEGEASVKEPHLRGPSPDKDKAGDLFESRRERVSPEYRHLVGRYFEVLQRSR